MEKEFVTYEQSLALKELGFDEPCIMYYNTDKDNNYSINDECNISAPLYQQAFRWFREKYKIISVIDFYNNGEEWEDTEYKVTISEFEHFATHDTFVKEGYVTYEEAELECLKKLIEIVKN